MKKRNSARIYKIKNTDKKEKRKKEKNKKKHEKIA